MIVFYWKTVLEALLWRSFKNSSVFSPSKIQSKSRASTVILLMLPSLETFEILNMLILSYFFFFLQHTKQHLHLRILSKSQACRFIFSKSILLKRATMSKRRFTLSWWYLLKTLAILLSVINEVSLVKTIYSLSDGHWMVKGVLSNGGLN